MFLTLGKCTFYIVTHAILHHCKFQDLKAQDASKSLGIFSCKTYCHNLHVN